MSDNPQTEKTAEDYLWEKRDEILCRAEISCVYHQKRERFFELFDKCGKAIAVIGGSAALAKLADPVALTRIALAITASSTLSLVFSFADRSKKHAEFAKSYKALLADIALAGERDFVESDLSKWESRLLTIEGGEPPALTALVIICENQLKIARNDKASVVKIPFYKQLLAHFWDFDRQSIEVKA
jgi:hypothetical protein